MDNDEKIETVVFEFVSKRLLKDNLINAYQVLVKDGLQANHLAKTSEEIIKYEKNCGHLCESILAKAERRNAERKEGAN
jgi:uncharacterized membrane-anchored protein YhcB (DUF1043 family)